MSYTRYLAWTALVAALVGCALSGVVYWKITDEGKGRRDQSCVLFEREYLANLGSVKDERDRLARTLEYLDGLSPAERSESLNRAVAKAVPETRRNVAKAKRQAVATRPPSYCLAPGVGL